MVIQYSRRYLNEQIKAVTQPTFTCSKLTIETLKQGVKHIQS